MTSFKGVDTSHLNPEQRRRIDLGGIPDEDLLFRDDLVCPYCGAIQTDLFEVHGAYEEGDFDCECGTCSGQFRFSTTISYSYSIEKITKDDEG